MAPVRRHYTGAPAQGQTREWVLVGFAESQEAYHNAEVGYVGQTGTVRFPASPKADQPATRVRHPGSAFVAIALAPRESHMLWQRKRRRAVPVIEGCVGSDARCGGNEVLE